MTFDWTVSAGNVLTAASMVVTGIVVIVAFARWQTKTDARLEQVEVGKVSTTDCVRAHVGTVTTTFCTLQHQTTNSVLAKLSEEFGGLGLQVQKLIVNQEWVIEALKTLHAGVKVANPHPAPLPPDPREPGEER